MEIYWNRQKASLWQEAVGNTQAGTHAHGNCGNRPGGPVGICLCLLFAFFPGLHFSWVYRVKDVFWGSGWLHKQKASSSRGYNQPKLPETEKRRTGEKCAEQFCAPVASLSPATAFSCVLEMLERWTLQFHPLFSTFGGRNCLCIVTVV